MGRQKKREQRIVSARRRVTEHQSGVSLTSINIPEGMQLYQIKKAGTYRFDILPYVVGKGNPFADEGDLYYERTFFSHRGVGPDSASYVCLGKTFKLPCPICEFRAKMARDPDADEKVVKELAPKERQVFNVIDLNEPDKGVQLFEYSHFLFGKALDAKVKGADDNEYDLFADLAQGLSLKVYFEEEKGAGYTFYKASDIEFKPRRKGYDESILEQTACLDEVPRQVPYAELKKIFLQEGADDEGDEDDDEEEDTPKKPGKKPGKKVVEEDDDDEDIGDEDPTASEKGIKVGSIVAHEDLGECKVVHVSGDGTSLRLEDKDGDVHKAIAPSACEVVEKQKPGKAAAKPAPKSTAAGKTSKKGSSTASDDDDDGDDEWDDEGEEEDAEPEEDEDEEDEDEDEEPPAKKKPGRKPAAKKPAKAPAKKGKKAADDDDEDDEEEDSDDDDEDWEDD